VLYTDPTGMSLWSAARYGLSIRTNRVLIVSSALGYFFFSGLRTRTSGFVSFPPKKSPAGPAAKQPDPADVSILKR